MRLVRRDVALIETDAPWAFRPGDLVHASHGDFEITRIARHWRSWLRAGRAAARYVVYGAPVRDDRPHP